MDPHRVPRIDIELTTACDQRCGHCYNVWTARDGDPQAGFDVGGRLATPAFKELMSKAVEQSGCRHITITGGEPLVHKDALELIGHACSLVPAVRVISNGGRITPEVVSAFAQMGLQDVQLTLLAGSRQLHDQLKGAVSFDDTIRAATWLVEAGVGVNACYVAMKTNAGELAKVLELCFVLGIKSLAYNRMSASGGAIHHVVHLMPSAKALEADLQVAERLGPRYGVRVATAMPVPPCLVRTERYEWVSFGYCSTGTASPNVVIDARGNVRSCNLSSRILGNLLGQDWAEVMSHPYPAAFRAKVPELCQGCAHFSSCVGGCKESAFATFGTLDRPDPLVWIATHGDVDELPDQGGLRPHGRSLLP